MPLASPGCDASPEGLRANYTACGGIPAQCPSGASTIQLTMRRVQATIPHEGHILGEHVLVGRSSLDRCDAGM